MKPTGRQRHIVLAHHVAPMPLDPGTVHRFAMLERAVKSFAKTGRFDESLKSAVATRACLTPARSNTTTTKPRSP